MIVSAIDTATHSVVATVPVGKNTWGVAMHPDGSRAYVTSFVEDEVSVIDTLSNTVIDTIPVGVNRIGIAAHPSGAWLYVANSGVDPNQSVHIVSVIDIATKAVAEVQLDAVTEANVPFGIAVHPDGTKVYLTNQQGNFVSVLSINYSTNPLVTTPTHALVDTADVRQLPQGIAVNPLGNEVYVANADDGTVSVLSTVTNSVTDTIPLSPFALYRPYAVDVHPDGGKDVWVKGPGSASDGYPFDTDGIDLLSRDGGPQIDCLIEGSRLTGFERPIFLHSQYVGCTIKDTVFGIDPDGNPIGNKNGVLLIGDGFSVIGSTISATQSRIALDVRGDDAVVKGNRIGTDPTGKELIGNPGGGVLLQGDGAEISRNVVAGSPFAGLAVFGNDNEFYMNRIGTDVRGVEEDFGNGGIGLVVDGDNNCIGTLRKHAGGQCRMNDKTSNPQDFSVVSGNKGHGISIAGDGNVLLAHTVGTDVNHTTAIRNAGHGVSMELGAVNTLITDNVISGNRASGLFLRLADETVVRANQIGTDITGTLELPNTEHGILIETGLHNIIGGTEDGDGNIIAFNDGDGIRALTNLTVENAFLGNSIFGNGELGIDLGGNGVTPNDYLDLDHKPPNRGQNYPKVRSTPDSSTGRTTVDITLSSEPSTTYRVEVFANDEPDESGYGEGQYYLGSTDLTTDEDGEASATVSFPGLHSNVSATATDPDGNTSEFSSIRGLIVNSTSDGNDEDPGNGICDTGNVVDREGTQEPECTLRAAVQETNSKASPGQIDFDIPQPGTPIIALDSGLPVVTAPLLLDATTQSSGEVEVIGTSIAPAGPDAGPSASANGLEFSVGPVMVKGVAIRGFPGNGVQANGGVVLTLKGVEIADNCGWGVRVKRRLTVVGSTEDPARISGNGTAQGCLGGSVLAFGVGRVSVSDAEIVSDGGPGILTRGDVDLRGARVNSNRGDGIRSQGDSGGSVSILEGVDNQINRNLGNGIAADQGVEIKDSSVDINDNSSWGIRAGDENILINAGVTELSAPQQSGSTTTGRELPATSGRWTERER